VRRVARRDTLCRIYTIPFIICYAHYAEKKQTARLRRIKSRAALLGERLIGVLRETQFFAARVRRYGVLGFVFFSASHTTPSPLVWPLRLRRPRRRNTRNWNVKLSTGLRTFSTQPPARPARENFPLPCVSRPKVAIYSYCRPPSSG